MLSIRKPGYKSINPYTIPQLEEQRLICSNHYGAKSWPPAAYNPNTKRLYLPLNEGCLEVGPDGRYQILTTNIQMSEALFPDSDGNMGRVQALDLENQEFDWIHHQPSPVISSILATAGGLVFAGDLNHNFRLSMTKPVKFSGKEYWTMCQVLTSLPMQ
ncbi:MAG: hypothetical protein Ct9H300mP19_16360 [Dehalococcoidia bacterium]|nr:MAG: hypothetical protein Ct9H300mP19_16360 [Dehalococcoidia bacterium]